MLELSAQGTWPTLGVREGVPEEVTFNFYLNCKYWLGGKGNLVTRGRISSGLELLQGALGWIRLTQDTSITPAKHNSNNILVWWCINKIIFIHEELYILSPHLTRFKSKYIHLSYIWKALSFNILTPASAEVIFGTIFLWLHKPQWHFIFWQIIDWLYTFALTFWNCWERAYL